MSNLDDFLNNTFFDNAFFPLDRAARGMLYAAEHGFERLPDNNNGLEPWEEKYEHRWRKKLLVTIGNNNKSEYTCVVVDLVYRPPKLKGITVEKEGSWRAEARPEIHGGWAYQCPAASTPPSLAPSICLGAIAKDVMKMIKDLQDLVRVK